MDVQLAVGGFVEDTWVALHGPLVQGEGNLWESVQVQARLSQHQRQHLRAHAHTDESSSGRSVSCLMGLTDAMLDKALYNIGLLISAHKL